MKKALLGTTALAVALGFASVALADADVDAHIDFNKYVNVDEILYVEKALFIKAQPKLTPAGAAEAAAVANIGHNGNYFNTPTSGESSAVSLSGDQRIILDAKITDAVHSNSGVISVNYDIGIMNNQGNLVSMGVTQSATAAADSQAETSQHNNGNAMTELGAWGYSNNTTDGMPNGALVFRSRRTATLENTVHSQTGITGLNQTSGVMNNQTNSVALAVGLNSTVALSEAALGQAASENTVNVADFSYANTVTNAVRNNTGITHVNQASGNLNNQSSTIAFSATTGLNQATAGVTGQKF
ncbi:MAG: hypothetical protein AB7K86_00495 [Rhodospirillales bacterium]